MAGPVPKATIKLTPSWGQLTSLLATAVPKAMKEVERATGINGMLVARTVRQTIKSGSFDPNRPLTKFIKGSSKPLVGRDAQLWRAITSKVIDPYSAEIGVLKGDPIVNIAVVVHEGTVIKVTPKMRRMFMALAAASEEAAGHGVKGGSGKASHIKPIMSLSGRARELWEMRPKKGWKGLKASTTHIKIPARPFISQAINDPALQDAIKSNWLMAVAAGIAGYTPKLKTKL